MDNDVVSIDSQMNSMDDDDNDVEDIVNCKMLKMMIKY